MVLRGARRLGAVSVPSVVTVSAAGVASLLQANPSAFAVVKWVGASYLLWLAIGMLRAAWGMWRSRVPVADQIADAAVEAGVEPKARGERPYRRALVISLLNPKAILFFVAFFVQFVDPAYAHPVVSFLVLGTLATLARRLGQDDALAQDQVALRLLHIRSEPAGSRSGRREQACE